MKLGRLIGQALLTSSLLGAACQRQPVVHSADQSATRAAAVSATPAPRAAPDVPATATASPPAALAVARDSSGPPLSANSAPCRAADWSAPAEKLKALLRPGKSAARAQPDRVGARQLLFSSSCTDAPNGPTRELSETALVDGVTVRLTSATPAGASKRGWLGNQCEFDFGLADASGKVVHLGPERVPPFSTLTAIARRGSAVWVALGFNGYTTEFPEGGNRIVALDLCEGRVVWQSKDSMSNGGLLLLDDYLVSPFGFTNEPRYVFVLDARSGEVVQRLPVLENVCPNTSWAPNWRPGTRCDAPGQRVGAATDPRVEGGLFLVDTNTGSSAFQFE